ncbi:hypothetical protein ASE19_23410 [Nocardioides sp. Root79]|nr:hypothetical protein ASE19_23410 [Nocardioides sp. Root79]
MMSHPDDDLDGLDGALGRLLGDAVADVSPNDRLGEIRRRTLQQPRRAPRRWPLVVLGAGVTTAAVVGAVALAGHLGLPGADEPPVASGPRQAAVATYFVGETAAGPRLFREFQAISPNDEEAPLALAALRLLESDAGPLDPDYTTDWSDGAFTAVTVTDSRIEVRLADRVDPLPADPAAQQAVFTVQAALGSSLPVAFRTPEGTLRVDGQESVGRDNALLAPVNVTDPVEGHTVDDLLTVRGVVSPVGPAPTTVAWELHSPGDAVVVASGSTPVVTRAWEQTTSIADVPPGTYELRVSVPMPGAAPATDTRTLTVR